MDELDDAGANEGGAVRDDKDLAGEEIFVVRGGEGWGDEPSGGDCGGCWEGLGGCLPGVDWDEWVLCFRFCLHGFDADGWSGIAEVELRSDRRWTGWSLGWGVQLGGSLRFLLFRNGLVLRLNRLRIAHGTVRRRYSLRSLLPFRLL